jgi:hypothetical protein
MLDDETTTQHVDLNLVSLEEVSSLEDTTVLQYIDLAAGTPPTRHASQLAC